MQKSVDSNVSEHLLFWLVYRLFINDNKKTAASCNNLYWQNEIMFSFEHKPVWVSICSFGWDQWGQSKVAAVTLKGNATMFYERYSISLGQAIMHFTAHGPFLTGIGWGGRGVCVCEKGKKYIECLLLCLFNVSTESNSTAWWTQRWVPRVAFLKTQSGPYRRFHTRCMDFLSPPPLR